MRRLALILFWSWLLCYSALLASSGTATKLFDLPMTIMVGLCGVASALSIGFHSYIDGITKDLPKKTEIEDQSKLASSVEALGVLRSEILSNLLLIFSLLVVYSFLYGCRQFIDSDDETSRISWSLISLQFACVIAVICSATLQALGFRRATRLRDLIASNR